MKNQSYDAVVVGAGIWGCTVARTLADRGENVLVLERSKRIGGACSSRFDRHTGDEVCDHGPHVFHTSDKKVWGFVNRFAEFNNYRHSVVSLHNGKYYRMPVGLDLINKFFGVEFNPSQAQKLMSVDRHRDAIFDAFFKNYSFKQWGFVPEKSSEIISRVKMGFTFCNDYFDDEFQGVPVDGYQSMFRRMLDSWRITVKPGFAVTAHEFDGELKLYGGGDILPDVPVYYSGSPDELFCYKYGTLPYRTATFEHRIVEGTANGCAVVNFADMDIAATRCTEWRYFHPESLNEHGLHGVITYETPCEWSACGNPRYWPIVKDAYQGMYLEYRHEAMRHDIILGGRLGKFKYFDMDDAINDAFESVDGD